MRLWSFTETAIHVSKANSKNVEKVMSDCDFSTRTPRWDKLPRYLHRYSFEPFQWNYDLPEHHDTNREAYLRFLSDIIDVPNYYSIFDSSRKIDSRKYRSAAYSLVEILMPFYWTTEVSQVKIFRTIFVSELKSRKMSRTRITIKRV